MSKQVKKPAEQIPTKIKNVDLLPNVFATDPNRKMLASTVDVMISKGQLLPFKETYGLRNASNRIEEFFKVEEEQPRRESQGNNMLVVKDNSDSYLGKVSYYDIENYFAIKGFQLKDGVVLDKNVNVLDLPIDSVKLADFNMYYWLVNDLPACRIHLNPKAGGGAKFSMIDDLLGMPFATLVDDLTGKELELQNGMALYFTGEIDAVYKTASDTENNITEEPKIFFVYGVGSGIELFAKTDIEYRVPDVTFEKRPWDEYGKILEYPESSWDNRVWDGSRNIADTIEYVVQEKYTENTNHWQAIDRWYHVNTIRAVATFLGISTEDFVSSANKAVRPIISFNRHVKLHNWPTGSIREINSILRNTISYYQGQIEIQDQFGYKLANDDIVVFERTAGIWKVSGLPGAATFTQVYSAAENDGAIIITPGRSLHYQVIYRNGQWNLAQNKTTKNQTPLFEFYLDNGTNVETLNGTTFTGGVILGFKPGDVYDEILGRYVDVNLIESESTLVLSSPNQINFTTDIDREFTYLDPVTNDEIKITGPYGYKSKDKLLPFYKSRNGLDFTKQMQDLLFVEPEGSEWSAEFEPVASGFDSIHIFYDDVEKYKFYYNVDGYGLVRFSSKFSGNFGEEILPLVSGSKFKIICHDLPHAVTFYKAIVTDNITKPQTITSSYITNNGIQNGTIEIDLSDTVTVGSSVIDNELAAVDYKLLWTVGSPSNYKIAYVNPARKWNFLQSVFVKDQTYPLYEGYDYIVNDITLSNGDLSYYKQISDAGSLNKIANSYDKICVESVIENPISKTAPVSFTDNPLNAKIDTIQYYSLYQHAAAIKSNSTNIVKFNNSDVEVSTPTFFMGGGTIFKHNDPLSKFAVTATNLPYELTDLFIRQGKHYDLFLNKLKVELEKIVDTIEVSNYSSLDILNRALNGIYVVDPSDDLFWSHSNMIGWGTQDSDYSRATVTVSSGLRFNLNNSSYNFENISHRTGKESLLHISYNGRILLRGYDYWLNSTGTEYTQIEFRSFYANKQVVISQWFTTFRSLVPASLAKIGLTPVYRPEIYADTSYLPHAYFMIRHDGTKYFLKAGIDATTGLPLDPTEYYLYEYEKAVWSSIARDVERNNQVELLETSPGYFRDKPYTYNQYRLTVENEVRQWMLENSIFVMENNDYNATDGFTLKYRVGSGDGETVEGSWRAIYEYMYDTDRPHTHPWEMLGYTLKPWWWDTHYSWTDATKRIALKKALRLGKVSNPSDPVVINPAFARNIAIDYATPNTLEDFPVTNTGALMSPKDFINYLDSVTNLTTVVTLSVLNENTNWAVGNLGPYEQIFLNSHRGLAARVRARYLASPGEFMSSNWVPGQTVKNAWGHKVDRTTQFWQQGLVAHDYHRKLVDGDLVYTGGIESLYSEFCLLNNKDYESEVIAKFNNLVVNKEFMLGGFTNKDNIRIQSTSIGTQKTILFIPEENYQVRTVKHYPHKEIFYSGMKIVWDGESYTINGFATEFGQFPYYLPKETSDTAAREIGNVVIKEKLDYSKEIAYLGYGSLMNNRQEIYDFIIGYGKYLEDLGVVYEEPEGGDIRNWQLSAKQFIFWSNDLLAPGNFIDLNPNADFIKISTPASQLENLEGTNENVGQCVDRFGRPLFSKDLLVMRDDYTVIKTKNTEDGIYGIKLAFVNYETVVHLDSTSIFNDIYFEPAQNLTKRSFIIGGKKTVGWNGSLNSPGYIFNGDELLPNLDSLAEVGRNLLDVENVVFDPVIRDASRNQFGLSRNPELRQLFIEESNETLFKTAITYNKGTRQVFDSLNPLTHQDGSKTIAYEEYMVRVGEFGNTKNIEFYEFELKSEDMVFDSQVIKFVPTAGSDVNTIYVTHDSDRWVYKPYNKNLQFKVNTETTIKVLSQKGSPILPGDTDLAVESIEDLPDLYDKFADLWSIPQYVPTVPHKLNDKVRVNGRVYQAVKNVPPAPWADVSDDFIEVNEPALPNVYVNNYKKPNPNLSNSDPGPFTPATWQVLQTTDNKLAITETCPGPNDVSKARVTTDDSHKVTAGDYVLIVNATTENSSVNGIWEVDSVDPNNNSQFYINTRIKETIKAGKVFVFRPVRFKNTAELALATADKGYDWTPKVNDTAQRISTAGAGVDSIPVTALPSAPPVPTPAPTPAPVISGTLLMTYYVPATGVSEPEAVVDNTVNVDNLPGEYDEPAITPSGYDKKYPIAIVDNDSSYKVYQIEDPSNLLSNIIIKQETFSLDVDDIEHLIVYDYDTNKTIAKIELFNPDTLDIPQVFKNDVDIIGRVDPAKYNRTTDNFKSVYTSLGWYEEYVGRRWWNTSSVQLADYNSGDDYTKANYWGMTNSNEPLEVYEWTKSTVHPSKWNELVKNKTIVFDQLATGEVYVDRSLGVDNYHWVEEEDYVSGKTYTVYYFWVKNKKTIAPESKWARTYTTDQLSKALLNPSAAGIPWWCPINADTIVVKGIKPYLNNNSTVVQIKKKLKGEEKHQQWVFVSENNTVETIPEWLHLRLRDSLSAHVYYSTTADYTAYNSTASYNRYDVVKYSNNFYICRVYMKDSQGNPRRPAGLFSLNDWYRLSSVEEISDTKVKIFKEKSVPDILRLHRFNRYGNTIRPYIQSWFKDLREARRTFIRKLNEVLLNVNVVDIPKWPNTILNNTNYTEADQSIDMTKFWTYADFRSEDFDSTRIITATLNDVTDLYSQSFAVGNYIRVNVDFRNYIIYERTAAGGFSVVYKRNGTIQFNEEFDPYGWDSTVWDGNLVSWDYDLNLLFNAILNSMRTEIFLGRYLKNYSVIMCSMFRYVLSEQVNVDWLAKSSTIEPVNLIAQTLENSDYLKRDEISSLINFYGSVKSYRDKIRSSTINKVTLDLIKLSTSERIDYEDITDADTESAPRVRTLPIQITGFEIN